jgi:4-hydroxy-tetrahydrodipicolinate reductase
MKIGIVGYGQMGKIVEKVVKEKGHEYVIIDPFDKSAKYSSLKNVKDGIDVFIDFTIPAAVMENITIYAKLKKNVVMGTTGWDDNIVEIEKIVNDSGIGFIYSSNFSIGVNIFFRVVEEAARIVNKFEDYDVFGYELHHRKKMDSPSGTAKSIAEILVNKIDRKTVLHFDKLDRKPDPNELHFASIRAGHIPGTHIVGFDSEVDTIEIKHTARNRNGFAIGSVFAGEWIIGKKGFFTKEDMMSALLDENE